MIYITFSGSLVVVPVLSSGSATTHVHGKAFIVVKPNGSGLEVAPSSEYSEIVFALRCICFAEIASL